MSLILLVFVPTAAVCIQDLKLDIDLENSAATTDSRFLSVNLGGECMWRHFKHTPLMQKRFFVLATGLSPQLYLRVGGSDADHMKFIPNMHFYNRTDFDELNDFADKIGWKLVYGLNSLDRYPDGEWDPTNSVELIKYSVKKGYEVQFELGNEPDLYPSHLNITIAPEKLADDFKMATSLLGRFSNASLKLIGPDVATLDRYKYFGRFLSSIGKDILLAISFHHYYGASGHIQPLNFTSVKYLDSFLHYLLHAKSIIEKSISNRFVIPPIWIGESSSTYGGGSKVAGETFAAGFVWLDKLGLASQMNISVVAREALKGAHYSLINHDMEPNPDYWSAVLFKQLVGRRVLKVTGFLQLDREIRVYAYCTKETNTLGYVPGSIVLMALNVNPNESARLWLKYRNVDADQYLLTPSNGNIGDKMISLNGDILRMVNDTLPKMKPRSVAPPFTLPSFSYGYFVVKNPIATICKSKY